MMIMREVYVDLFDERIDWINYCSFLIVWIGASADRYEEFLTKHRCKVNRTQQVKKFNYYTDEVEKLNKIDVTAIDVWTF